MLCQCLALSIVFCNIPVICFTIYVESTLHYFLITCCGYLLKSAGVLLLHFPNSRSPFSGKGTSIHICPLLYNFNIFGIILFPGYLMDICGNFLLYKFRLSIKNDNKCLFTTKNGACSVSQSDGDNDSLSKSRHIQEITPLSKRIRLQATLSASINVYNSSFRRI